ncbi:putative dithiol-disulfide isomerase, DsbA family [Geosmithia morbida]|uniref:Dithiol-disulfide isomerase, DsbA family n=1 Tax=Geosmithia morbida TaxID=1094350 RepID=A0A9P4Z1B1_9HYPO|nr:putative dithiol-disulfide isomerase, DsbA family [Geosmithia morbida]KAF4125587.1 putative dithiol-disulfide isomerase, DsbA family [Geosmithia morbida]
MAVSHPTKGVLIRIEVHVDMLCPWCYIAKRSLDAAIKVFQTSHPEFEFEEAQPNNFQAVQDRIRSAAARYNISLSFTGRTGPSRDSHKLIALALQQRDPAAQARTVDRLFRGHFEEGRDLTDGDWLVEVGVEAAGLDAADVRRALASHEAGISVDDEVRSASVERGVRAVPCVTMQGRYRVGGYQDQSVFEDLFDKIRTNGGN